MLKQKKHCYYNYPRDRKNPIMRSKDFQQMWNLIGISFTLT
jgi:hypothetical protein